MSTRKAHLYPIALALAVGLIPCRAHATCPSAVAEVVVQAEEATEAFARMDEASFAVSRDAMREELSCLSDTPSPSDAARVHRAEALAWFQVKDHTRTVASLRAMLAASPSLTLSEEVAPPNGELDRWLQEAREAPSANRAPVQAPEGYRLWVDGVAGDDLPADRPALVLLVDLDGHVAWSGFVPAGGTIPQINPLSRVVELPAAPRIAPGRVALLAAGGTALATGGLWFAAARSRSEVLTLQEQIAAGQSQAEIGLDGQEARDLYSRTSALFVSAEVGSAVALGLVGVGLVLSW